MKQVSIAVVDDHGLFREGIMLILGQIPGFRILFDASDGGTFLARLGESCPDVVLMDIQMPGMDGGEVTKLALAIRPGLRVIALTMFSDQQHYSRMIQGGVKGFLLKSGTKQELEQAIRVVAQGGVFFSQEILRTLVLRTTCAEEAPGLSARELEVLALIGQGLTSPEISERLVISLKTVEGHRTKIFQKAGVRNIAELILWAIRNGFLSLD